MFIGILFYSMYILAAVCTTQVACAVFGAYLSTHQNTRNLGIEWISWPLGVLTGITWPITIPAAIIIAGVIK